MSYLPTAHAVASARLGCATCRAFLVVPVVAAALFRTVLFIVVVVDDNIVYVVVVVIVVVVVVVVVVLALARDGALQCRCCVRLLHRITHALVDDDVDLRQINVLVELSAPLIENRLRTYDERCSAFHLDVAAHQRRALVAQEESIVVKCAIFVKDARLVEHGRAS